MHLKPQRVGEFGTPAQAFEFFGGGIVVTVGQKLGVMAGMQFDDSRADAGGGLDLAGVMADEHGDAAARFAQGGDVIGQTVGIACDIKPAFGGAFFALFRHEADGVGAMA